MTTCGNRGKWRILAIALLVLSLPCCQVATPASRIQENPVLFQALPEKDRALVQQGQIREGMSPEAVYLAWGYPDSQPFEGQKDGKHVTRWEYTTLEPVLVNAPCHPWHCCPYDDFRGMPETAYVRRPAAYVTFENGKVVAWEARRLP